MVFYPNMAFIPGCPDRECNPARPRNSLDEFSFGIDCLSDYGVLLACQLRLAVRPYYYQGCVTLSSSPILLYRWTFPVCQGKKLPLLPANLVPLAVFARIQTGDQDDSFVDWLVRPMLDEWSYDKLALLRTIQEHDTAANGDGL